MFQSESLLGNRASRRSLLVRTTVKNQSTMVSKLTLQPSTPQSFIVSARVSQLHASLGLREPSERLSQLTTWAWAIGGELEGNR